MIIERVRLQNVGAFEGDHEILLDTKAAKPIVLIGGMNGAGKTTLFNSILIGLYGQGWEAPQSRLEYEQQLRSMTRRTSKGERAAEASMEVQFRHTHLGDEKRYVVKRSWKLNEKSVREWVEIREGDRAVEDVDPEHWNQLIRELIPRGVSNLFFFDGEKIKDLASDDEAHAIALQDSFDALLGLDVVDQLRADLAHVSSNSDGLETAELHDEVRRRNDAINEQALHLDFLREEKKKLQGQIEVARRKAERLEGDLARAGGVYATKRDEYKAKRSELEEQARQLEATLHELAGGCLPFAFASTAVQAYVQQVKGEQENAYAQAAADAVTKIQRSVTSKLTQGKALDWFTGAEAKNEALKALRETFAQYKTPVKARVRHGYSTSEAERVISELDHRLVKDTTKASDVAKKLKSVRTQLRRVQSFLSKVPEDSQHQQKIQRVLQELGDVTKLAAHLEAQLAETQHSIEQSKQDLEKAINDRDELDKKLRKAENFVTGIHRAAACREALREYQEQLRHQRRSTLQQHLSDCLKLLTNKGETYAAIELDDDMRLHVQTRDGMQLPFHELSAGERQIIATALLWALSRTSGRPLPFVIDTPLGRLDSKHREQLVERFYPQAGHQVIILSTDTEVNEEYTDRLKDHVGRSYLLHYEPKKEATTVKAGYFGGAQ